MKNSAIDSYVRQLMRSRDLTLHGLCDILGYRSMTSLTRIMQGSANRESLIKFSERLHASSDLALTRQESNQLDDLIELRDIGDDDFGAMVALRRMLRGEASAAQSPLMLHMNNGSAIRFLSHYSTVRVKRMMIINSESVSMYHDLSLLLAKKPFPVEHVMFAGQNPLHTVQSLHAAMPVLHSASYQSFSFSISNDPAMVTRGLITSDILFCDYETKDKRTVHELVVFVAPDAGYVQEIIANIDEVQQVFPPRSSMMPIRASIPDEDMLQYNAFCMELENECGIYRIKPDLGIEQIPTRILERAVSETAPPDVLQALGILSEQFVIRQRNLLAKTAPQYHMMKRRAMWQFVRTGHISDHLWCCRDFTMQERADILCFLRDELMSRPGFHLHFFKDDDALRDDEIILYEGKGLSIIKPGTDYDLHNDHVESLITQPEFLRFYKRFFMESTLRYRVETEDASRQEIDRMIAFCLDAC